MQAFSPHLEILPAAQRRLWGELSAVPEEFVLYGGTALAAGRALYGPSFNPEITLKALSYFGDGNLHGLPVDVRDRLAAAARDADLDHLPVIDALPQGATSDHGNGL